MAVTTVQDIFDRVYLILQDDEGTRWNEQELLKWLNSAYQQTLLHRPDANARSVKVYFPHNESCQNLNKLTTSTTISDATNLSSALRLLDVTRNLPADGDIADTDEKRMGAIRGIDKRQFDDQRRGWHGVAASGTLQYFMYDERNPKELYVYPRPKPVGESDRAYVEVVVSESVEPHKNPQNPPAQDGSLPHPDPVPANPTPEQRAQYPKLQFIELDDIYVEPLIDYIVARCYQKDADYAGQRIPRADAHGAVQGRARHQDRGRHGGGPRGRAPGGRQLMAISVEDMVAELRPYVSGAADFTIEDVLRRTMDEFYTESRSWLSVAHLEWPHDRVQVEATPEVPRWTVPYTIFVGQSLPDVGTLVELYDFTTSESVAGSQATFYGVVDSPAGGHQDLLLGSVIAGTRAVWDSVTLPTQNVRVVGTIGVFASVNLGEAADTFDYAPFPATYRDGDAYTYDPIPAPAADAAGADISSSAAAFEAIWVAPLTGRSDTDPGTLGIPLTRTAGMDDLATRRARPRAEPSVFAFSDGKLSMDPLPAESMDFLVACALKPTPAATEIPDDAMGTNKTYIVEGALAYLCRMPNQAWTSQAASERYMHRFQNGIAEARAEVMGRWGSRVRQPLAPFSFDGYRKP